MNEITFNEDGSAVLNIAPENAESFKAFKTDADLSGFIKSSAAKIALPGENASAEEIAAFNKALGVPDKPEDYGITFKDEAEAALFKKNLEELQKAGVPKRQAENLIKGWQGEIEAKKAEIAQKYENSEKELSAEWKEQKENNKAEALKAAALLGFDKDVLGAIEQIIGPKETWLRFYDLSLKMKDSALKGGDKTAPNYADKGEAVKKLSELINDPAFRERLIKGDPAAKKQWDELNRSSSGAGI